MYYVLELEQSSHKMSASASSYAAFKPYQFQLFHATTNSVIALWGQSADPSVEMFPNQLQAKNTASFTAITNPAHEMSLLVVYSQALRKAFSPAKPPLGRQ